MKQDACLIWKPDYAHFVVVVAVVAVCRDKPKKMQPWNVTPKEDSKKKKKQISIEARMPWRTPDSISPFDKLSAA